MKVELEPGKYIVAVSGGVDSMVLAYVLNEQYSENEDYGFIGVHYDHGIHKDSKVFSDFVTENFKRLGWKSFSEEGKLGPDTSEALARDARYEFLRRIKKETNSGAILTAHHQDDVIETMIINIVRGTGRKGLSSLKNTDEIIRSLLRYSKDEIVNFGNANNIEWKEDPTNTDEKYLRNYIRSNISYKMNSEQKSKLIILSTKAKITDLEVSEVIHSLIGNKNKIERSLFNMLGHASAKEVLAELFRSNKITFDSKLLEKCVVFCKTSKINKKISVSGNFSLVIMKDTIELASE